MEKHLQNIARTFEQDDFRQAHKDVAPLLIAAAKDQQFLRALIKKNLDKKEFRDKVRHYPTVGFPVVENADYTLVANCFLPLPDGSTDTSFQSVHHHGRLLLSTVSAFGPGYESALFKKGFEINKDSLETHMELDKFYHNPIHNLEFIPEDTPHVVFYPPTLSITLALWSNERREASKKLKRMPLLQKVKKPLKKVIQVLGMNAVAGLNVIEFHDFYPHNGKLIALKERIGYPEGSNENWLQNIFSIAQQVGIDEQAYLTELKEKCAESGQHEATQWIDKMLNQEEIALKFETSHLNIAKVNLNKTEVLKTFGQA